MAHHAGIDDDHVGSFRLKHRLVPQSFQLRGHMAAVGYVHLAAEGVNVIGFVQKYLRRRSHVEGGDGNVVGGTIFVGLLYPEIYIHATSIDHTRGPVYNLTL